MNEFFFYLGINHHGDAYVLFPNLPTDHLFFQDRFLQTQSLNFQHKHLKLIKMIASQLNLLLQNFKGCLGNPKINGGKHSSHFYQKQKQKQILKSTVEYMICVKCFGEKIVTHFQLYMKTQ